MPQSILKNSTAENKISSKDKSSKNWCIFYTAPRAEKVVYAELLKRDYEAFLPLIKTLRIWKNRQRKKVELPLFASYIFVYTASEQIHNILQLPKIATCITCGGKPSVLSEKEINCIQAMLGINENIHIEHGLVKGEKIVITAGPLAGFEGIIVNNKGKNRFGIQVEAINQTVFVEVDGHVLEKI